MKTVHRVAWSIVPFNEVAQGPQNGPFPMAAAPLGCDLKHLPARREKGRGWSHVLPGPCRVANKNPLPPKRAVLMPPACRMSKSTLGWRARKHPVSTCRASPAPRVRSTTVPPAWMKTMQAPSSFCMMKLSPPFFGSSLEPAMRTRCMPAVGE